MLKFGKPKFTNFSWKGHLCKKPLINPRGGEGERESKKVVMRVKVKMTKQEAVRLLSKCKDGGVLDFKDAAHALVKLPLDCISVISVGSAVAGSGGKAMLKTIPEEF